MKSYGKVVCGFDHEAQFTSHPKLSQRFTTRNKFKISSIEPHKMLKFELYDENGHDGIFKKMFSSSKMRLEIKVKCKNQHSSKHMEASSVMSISGENGIRLQDVLISLKNNPLRPRRCYNLSSEQLARVTYDYE